jgi:hypothetical protein
MSTIPFVQVEGSIALPRMRPLDRIPPPLGREWTLLPPHFSLRAEIKALYAAIMRTVCLSVEAFRAACRWDVHRRMIPDPAAAPVGQSAYAGASTAPAAAPFTASPNDRAAEPRAKASQSARLARLRSMSPADRSRFAGGVCAIAGAALLTWILASHAPHADKQTVVRDPARADHESPGAASQQLADVRAAHDLAVAGSAPIRLDSQATQPATVSQTAAPSPSMGAVTAAARPDYSTAVNSQAAQRVTLPSRSLADREERLAGPGSATASSTAADKPVRTLRAAKDRHAAHTSAPHRVAPQVTTHRTAGRYSEAGHYSPRQPSAAHDDDYASIVTYANTYTAPRPASRPSVPVDNTEWVNHVSQRRVTEIPGSFAK